MDNYIAVESDAGKFDENNIDDLNRLYHELSIIRKFDFIDKSIPLPTKLLPHDEANKGDLVAMKDDYKTMLYIMQLVRCANAVLEQLQSLYEKRFKYHIEPQSEVGSTVGCAYYEVTVSLFGVNGAWTEYTYETSLANIIRFVRCELEKKKGI